MNYAETIDFLYRSLPAYQRVGKAAYKDNLDNTIKLDKYLGHPHRNYQCIHIAGTNGKGSVSHMLASVLMEAGYRTGLYTSPHLRSFRERIKINGEMIDEDYVVSFVGSNQQIIEDLKPSFFEMTVAMAFSYFADKKVDLAVIETGLGGRLDSTNIIDPEIAVITNIGLEHTAFLGNTLEDIAAEKAGIIKKSRPVIIGTSQAETEKVFRNVAAKKESEIIFADKLYRAERKDNDYSSGNMQIDLYYLDYKMYGDLSVGLAGNYQLANIVAICAVTNKLSENFNLNVESFRNGLANVVKNTGLEGRWQVINTNPFVVCDTAHNFEGLTTVLPQFNSLRKKAYRYILGFVNDKDIYKILGILPGRGIFYFTNSSVPRSIPGSDLRDMAVKVGVEGRAYSSVREAWLVAMSEADKEDAIYVGGSTFVVADFLELIGSL